MDKKRIYVDMDDTICYYTPRYNQKKAQNPDIQWPQSQYGFFLSLRIMPNVGRYLYILSKYYDIWILTRPSVKNPLCYTEKRVWVEENLGPDWCEKLIICPDKSLLKGDYLIDDVAWPKFEGEQILFGGKDFADWKSVYQYLMKVHGDA